MKINIQKAEEIYSLLSDWEISRSTITNFFNNNKQNVDREIIIIKTILINSLYWTNLKKQIKVAEHILKVQIDVDLEKGSSSAVKKICDEYIENGKKRQILSFASKYCHFHNKDQYPIYDKYVIMALKKLYGWEETRERDYEAFIEAINSFRKNIDSEINLEEIDTFLWLYGQKIELDKDPAKKNINTEVRELYSKRKDLFNELVI
jgi:hypothetical protein